MEYEFYCGIYKEVFEFDFNTEEDEIDTVFDEWVLGIGLKDEMLQDIKDNYRMGYYRV